jgi:hypothetical protein
VPFRIYIEHPKLHHQKNSISGFKNQLSLEYLYLGLLIPKNNSAEECSYISFMSYWLRILREYGILRRVSIIWFAMSFCLFVRKQGRFPTEATLLWFDQEKITLESPAGRTLFRNGAFSTATATLRWRPNIYTKLVCTHTQLNYISSSKVPIHSFITMFFARHLVSKRSKTGSLMRENEIALSLHDHHKLIVVRFLWCSLG